MTEKEFNQLRHDYDVLKNKLANANYLMELLVDKKSLQIRSNKDKELFTINADSPVYPFVIDGADKWHKSLEKELRLLLSDTTPNQQKPQIIYNNNRVIARLDTDGHLMPVFYHGQCDNSHRELLEQYYKIFDTDDEDKMVPVFGAFYSLLSGNGMKPILVVYGESCDYPHSRLTSEQMDDYKDAFEKYCNDNNYLLLWKCFKSNK